MCVSVRVKADDAHVCNKTTQVCKQNVKTLPYSFDPNLKPKAQGHLAGTNHPSTRARTDSKGSPGSPRTSWLFSTQTEILTPRSSTSGAPSKPYLCYGVSSSFLSSALVYVSSENCSALSMPANRRKQRTLYFTVEAAGLVSSVGL